jgi:hypothetical protein
MVGFVALSLAWPSASAAQDRPVVFLHGLQATASDWATTAGRLQQRVAIDARIPSLPWRSPYESQAQSVNQSAELRNLSSDPFMVGHSNGGIVARELSRVRRLAGITTIGTPHRGAPIVPGFQQWLLFEASAPAILNNVLAAFGPPSDWSWTFAYVQGALGWMSDFSIWSVVYLGASLGVDASLPVMPEMQPGSAYLASLNSSANLLREGTQVESRVGIVSVAHNFYWAGPARAILPDSADQIATTLYGAAYGLLYWSSYIATEADPTDMLALRQSSSLSTLAGYMLQIDPVYCSLVSGTPVGTCVPNDGILPYTTQEYPGAANLYLGDNNDGPAHRQEKQWGENVLYDALVWFMHLPPRTSTPPVPQPPPPPPPPPPPGNPDPDPGDPGHHVPDPGSDPGLLSPDYSLGPGEYVESSDRRFRFVYQGDGNLVLYDATGYPFWASQTSGSTPGVLTMQGDGNLVIYDGASVPIWASGTSGHPGAYLILQTDGNVVIYDVDGTPIWATDTSGR